VKCFLAIVISQGNKKGHHYIVSASGPPEPTHSTQAMPLSPQAKEHRSSCVCGFFKLAVLSRTPKVQYLNDIQLSLSITDFASLTSKDIYSCTLPFKLSKVTIQVIIKAQGGL
jgi:hypothetical protein